MLAEGLVVLTAFFWLALVLVAGVLLRPAELLRVAVVYVRLAEAICTSGRSICTSGRTNITCRRVNGAGSCVIAACCRILSSNRIVSAD